MVFLSENCNGLSMSIIIETCTNMKCTELPITGQWLLHKSHLHNYMPNRVTHAMYGQRQCYSLSVLDLLKILLDQDRILKNSKTCWYQ